MPNSLVQFRLDDETKIQASLICNKLGIDLATYMRICIARLIANNGIPFEMKINDNASKGLIALEEMGRISKENGNANLTLEEINKEINKTRNK